MSHLLPSPSAARSSNLRPIIALLLALGVWGSAFAQETRPYALHIIGGLAGVNQYTRNEGPFWTQELPRLSGGRFTATIVPFDRTGIPGGDMVRLIQLGVVPFGTILMSSVAAYYPQFGAPDLAGLNPDMAHLKRNVAAFRPYLETQLRTRYKIDDYQATYFVIDSFQQLFDLSAPDFTLLYEAVRASGELAANASIASDSRITLG